MKIFINTIFNFFPVQFTAFINLFHLLAMSFCFLETKNVLQVNSTCIGPRSRSHDKRSDWCASKVTCHESVLNCLQSIGSQDARHANSDNALLHFGEGPKPQEIYLRVGYEIARQRDASIYGWRKGVRLA